MSDTPKIVVKAVKKKATRSKREPYAVITVRVSGTQLDCRCQFLPSTKVEGPMHPAHAAALEMLTNYMKAQRNPEDGE